MGLAASQVRFLQLTARKHDISRELQHLSNEKMSLTRDMQAVTRGYQSALSAKTMKWSSNAGVSYSDITYSTLMRQNQFNAKSPIMVTDDAGRIVIDRQYKQYAEMLSPDGAAGVDWSGSTRDSILAQLTGISTDDIKLAKSTSDAADNAAEARNKAQEELDKWKSKEPMEGGGSKYVTIDKLAKKLGSYGGQDLASLYAKGDNGNYSLTSPAQIEGLVNGIKENIGKYFIDDETYLKVTDKSALDNACKEIIDTYKPMVEDMIKASKDELKQKYAGLFLFDENSIFRSIDNSTDIKVEINIKNLVDQIMGAYVNKSGSFDSNDNKEKTYPLRDTTSSAWQTWYKELQNKVAAFDAADAAYGSSVNAANQVMTADQETKLEFYDLLFQSIADNGWVYDPNVEDTEYLNQMFQNNSYYITTIEKNQCYDADAPKSSRNQQFYYDTSLASNFDNIFMVNDSDARNEALVDYEYKKSIISSKESRIDTRMKNLETEQSAISQMLESIDQIKKDNIERTMNLWG